MRFVGSALLLLFVAATSAVTAQDYKLKIPLGLKKFKIPKDNPLTVAKIELGKQLYFDKRLSRDDTIGCVSCHDPKKGWSNAEAVATGVRGQQGGRSAPTIINAAFQTRHTFWDGRAAQAKFGANNALEAQALGPIQNPIEMDLTLDEVVAKLNKIEGYKKQFQAIFGSDVTSEGIAKAIAQLFALWQKTDRALRSERFTELAQWIRGQRNE